MRDAFIHLNEAIDRARMGVPTLLMDTDREGEADLWCAAETITPEVVGLMMRRCSGVLCVSLLPSWLEGYGIPPMSPHSPGVNAPFHQTIDWWGNDPDHASFEARSRAIHALSQESLGPAAWIYPGHLQLLRARPGLFDERRGHTEASIVMCNKAGLKPVGVLCELVGEHGCMVREPDEIISWCDDTGIGALDMKELYHG